MKTGRSQNRPTINTSSTDSQPSAFSSQTTLQPQTAEGKAPHPTSIQPSTSLQPPENRTAPPSQSPEAIAQALYSLANRFSLENPRRLLEAWLSTQTAESSSVTVAVVGRFKAGKSSLLNHLFGQDLLPTAAIPLTGIVTRLRYDPNPRAEVEFLDGHKEIIPIDRVADYVTERANPHNEKQVRQVTIYSPALSLLDPLEFIDTPGLDSALLHNTQATKQWLPRIEAALVCISCDAPLASYDLQLLQELRQLTPRIVLLLTKADLVSPSQREEIIRYVTDRLHQAGFQQTPIYLYSIDPQMEHLREQLLTQLLQPLRHSSGRVASEIRLHKLRTALIQIRDHIRVILAARQRSEAARETLRQKLKGTSEHLHSVRHSFRVLVQQWWASTLDETLQALAPAEAELTQSIVSQLEQKLREWHALRVPALIHTYQQWMQQTLREALFRLSESSRSLFLAPVQKFQEHLERELRGILASMSRQVYEVLGIQLVEPTLTWEIPDVESPPVDVSMEFLLPTELLGYLLPNFLLRAPLERSLRRKARYEVHKNLSRLAAAWRDRIRPVLDALGDQGIRYVENEAAALHHALEEQESTAEELTQLEQRLTHWLEALESSSPG